MSVSKMIFCRLACIPNAKQSPRRMMIVVLWFGRLVVWGIINCELSIFHCELFYVLYYCKFGEAEHEDFGVGILEADGSFGIETRTLDGLYDTLAKALVKDGGADR